MATGSGKTTVMALLTAWSILNKVQDQKRTREFITIDPKTTTARGKRYLTLEEFEKQVNAGMLTVLEREDDKDGHLKRVYIEAERFVESDTALVNRVLGRTVGGKQNILVFNDEAHSVAAPEARNQSPRPAVHPHRARSGV